MKKEENIVGERELDSTEEPLPEDITLEELQKDQHRKISVEDRKDSEEYLEKAGLADGTEEHL